MWQHRRAIAVAALALSLIAPAAVVANHQFTDVPTDSTFHGDIDAIAEAGITAGCGGTLYCPNDPVTRGSMAAFMRRSSGRLAFEVGTTPSTTGITVEDGHNSAPGVPVRDISIVVPGAANAFAPSQMVYLRGRIQLYGSMAGSCPCTFGAWIRDLSDGTVSPAMYQSFSAVAFYWALDAEAAFPATPGSHDYRLFLEVGFRGSAVGAQSWTILNGTSFTAMTFPFGPNGTNVLNP
jgi:hypothetical protein